MNIFNQFTNLYNVQKTLCFELQPVGKITDKVKQLLKQDKERNELAPKV